MMDIGLRRVTDGPTAARHLGMPIAVLAGERCEAFVRDHEVWLSYEVASGQSWLITAAAGSDLHLPGDAEGSAAILAGIVGVGCADPFGPPAPAWAPEGLPAVPAIGADRIVYAAHGGNAVVLAAVPAATAPPPMFDWLAPAA